MKIGDALDALSKVGGGDAILTMTPESMVGVVVSKSTSEVIQVEVPWKASGEPTSMKLDVGKLAPIVKKMRGDVEFSWVEHEVTVSGSNVRAKAPALTFERSDFTPDRIEPVVQKILSACTVTIESDADTILSAFDLISNHALGSQEYVLISVDGGIATVKSTSETSKIEASFPATGPDMKTMLQRDTVKLCLESTGKLLKGNVKMRTALNHPVMIEGEGLRYIMMNLTENN